jgi:hypothetical protein
VDIHEELTCLQGSAEVGYFIVGESVFGIYQIKQLPLNLQRKCECCDQELWFGKLMNHTKCRTVECLVTLPADELLSAYVAIPHGRRVSELDTRGLSNKPHLNWILYPRKWME